MTELASDQLSGTSQSLCSLAQVATKRKHGDFQTSLGWPGNFSVTVSSSLQNKKNYGSFLIEFLEGLHNRRKVFKTVIGT